MSSEKFPHVMTYENIDKLCDELNKVKSIVPAESKFTSEWLETEFKTVIKQRDENRRSYSNEYRIIKVLTEARNEIIKEDKTKLKKFIRASRIMRDIELPLKEIYKRLAAEKRINEEINRLLDLDESDDNDDILENTNLEKIPHNQESESKTEDVLKILISDELSQPL